MNLEKEEATGYILIAFIIGACFMMLMFGIIDQKITNTDITVAEQHCKVNGGIDYIEYNALVYDKVKCSNGASFDIVTGVQR
ncbi:MAG: hypothetical protein DRQ78_10895 [Epsilonproteobacteria bacterium]|nr:MAG: hypothetical protein DRQ78_10895 [Campylobacterota bacterium]